MANLNVRMSEEEYNKIKEDAVNFGFGTLEKPGISDYIRFLVKNVTISVTTIPPIVEKKMKINSSESINIYKKKLRSLNKKVTKNVG